MRQINFYLCQSIIKTYLKVSRKQKKVVKMQVKILKWLIKNHYIKF